MASLIQNHRQPHFNKKHPNAPHTTVVASAAATPSSGTFFRFHDVAVARFVQIILLGEVRSRLRNIDPRVGRAIEGLGPHLFGDFLFSCVRSLQISLYHYDSTSGTTAVGSRYRGCKTRDVRCISMVEL